ncbi:unnamed protein product [marine sediment metagenome]|uniref:Uncharacterized protein n=1 Tax=marine sediment metagenome TaxID=412755 RepID=X0X1V3_9ZZZZ
MVELDEHGDEVPPPEVIAHFEVCNCTGLIILSSYINFVDCKCKPLLPDAEVTQYYHADEDKDYFTVDFPVRINPSTLTYEVGRLMHPPTFWVKGKTLYFQGWNLDSKLQFKACAETWDQRFKRLHMKGSHKEER